MFILSLPLIESGQIENYAIKYAQEQYKKIEPYGEIYKAILRQKIKRHTVIIENKNGSRKRHLESISRLIVK